MTYDYLLDLALILLSTKVLGLITRKFHMPQVVGALLAGVILGPSMLNILTQTQFLTRLGEIGVIVIMFSAGMETDIHELKQSGKAGFLVALSGVVVPMLMGTGSALLALQFGWITEVSLIEAIFIGTILTATSVSITVETLRELGKLSTKVGNTILTAALIDDILGMIALAVVSSLAGGGESLPRVLLRILLFFIFAWVADYLGLLLFDFMIQKAKGVDLRRFPVLAFVLCLLMAYCAERVFGVADIIGAYAAGLVISSTPKAKYIQSKFEPLTYLLLTPIFFTGIGLRVHLTGLKTEMILFTILLLSVAMVSKILGCGGGAKLCGYTNKQSLRVGIGMACRGEVALVVADHGMSMGVLSPELMTPIVITVVVVAILTPILLKSVYPEELTLEQSNLADHYVETKQLDVVAAQLLEKTRTMQGQKPRMLYRKKSKKPCDSSR